MPNELYISKSFSSKHNHKVHHWENYIKGNYKGYISV